MRKYRAWVERIASAKEVGHFSNHDLQDISRFSTCMVGEAVYNAGLYKDVFDAEAFGHVGPHPEFEPLFFSGLDESGVRAQRAVQANNIEWAMECFIDIQDKVLALKRKKSAI